jgi:hypothetical protein
MPLPELAGTIPEVRLRPKVAKRPTIAVLPAPPKAFEPKPASFIEKSIGQALHLVEEKPRLIPQAPAKPDSALVGGTMPEKKPLVKAKKPAGQAPVTADLPALKSVQNSAAHYQPVTGQQQLMTAEIEARPIVAAEPPSISQKGQRVIPQAPAKPNSLLVGGTMPEKKPLVKVRKSQTKPAPATAKQSSAAQVSAPVIDAATPEKPAITPQPRASAAADKSEIPWTAGWMTWLPIAVGIAISSVAPTLHAMAAVHDPWGLRVVFPFVQLAALREIGMSDELTRTMPQLMLYLQFPLEGMLVAFNLRKGMKFHTAVAPIPALHFVAALTLWIVRLGAARPI